MSTGGMQFCDLCLCRTGHHLKRPDMYAPNLSTILVSVAVVKYPYLPYQKNNHRRRKHSLIHLVYSFKLQSFIWGSQSRSSSSCQIACTVKSKDRINASLFACSLLDPFTFTLFRAQSKEWHCLPWAGSSYSKEDNPQTSPIWLVPH